MRANSRNLYLPSTIAGLVLLVPMLVGSTTGTTTSHGSPSGDSAVPSSIDPPRLLAQYPPEGGIDFATASNTELLAHGYPARPPGTAGAVTLWRDAINARRRFVPVDPVVSSTYHKPPSQPADTATPASTPGTTHTIYTSTNWSAHWAPFSCSNVNYQHITWTESEWVQPSVSGNSAYSDYQNAPTSSFWNGVGENYIIQAGADSIATSTPQYRFWTEDYPQPTVWEGPTIRPGQTAYVYVQWNGDGTATYTLENLTTGDYSQFRNAAPYMEFTEADFVNERVGPYYLPEFADTQFISNYYGTGSGGWALQCYNSYWMENQTHSYYLSIPTHTDSSGNFLFQWQNPGP